MKSLKTYRPVLQRILFLVCITIVSSMQMSFKQVENTRQSILELLGTSESDAEKFVWIQLCNTNFYETAARLDGYEQRKNFIDESFALLRERSNSPEIVENYRKFREANKPDFYSEQSIKTRLVKESELESAIQAFQQQLKFLNKEEKLRILQQVSILKTELEVLDNPDIETRRWIEKYPESHMLVVRITLKRLLEETENIPFNATVRNCRKGKLKFINQEFEAKPASWKTAFLLGKEVTDLWRSKAAQWILEIESTNILK